MELQRTDCIRSKKMLLVCVLIGVAALPVTHGELGSVEPVHTRNLLKRQIQHKDYYRNYHDNYDLSSPYYRRADSRNGVNEIAGGPLPTGQLQQQDFYDPFYFFIPSSSPNKYYDDRRAPVSLPRNRRNSRNGLGHGERDYLLEEDYTSGKYNLLTKKAYGQGQGQPSAPGYNSNQFLTRDQLSNPNADQTRSRAYYPSNHIDQVGLGSYPQRTGGGGYPWSVQVGTQLKVQDDGRAPNPTRYYVKDERNSPHRRYPGYYRK